MKWHDLPLSIKAARLTLRYYGDSVLRRKSAPVVEITSEVRDLAQRMIVTMHDDRGIGLAAPQVGVNLRLITVYTYDDERPIPPDASEGERLLAPRMPVALLNPRVLAVSEEETVFEEGCLSVPGINADVVRPSAILFEAMLLDGNTLRMECGGLLARCLLHEIDHLDGVLFVDRVSRQDAARIAPKLKALKKRVSRKRGTASVA